MMQEKENLSKSGLSLLETLADPREWEDFVARKAESGRCSRHELEEWEAFLQEEGYRDVVRRILDGRPLSPPRKRQIQKKGTEKKRTVYIFPDDEARVLKLLNRKLQTYDAIFSPCLYSFRSRRCVRQALERVRRVHGLNAKYTYKADVHDYFNSVDIDLLEPMLRGTFAGDPRLRDFLIRMLRDPRILENGDLQEDTHKGIMAGMPVSGFLANLYLSDLDAEMMREPVFYARYSDDIFVLADTPELREKAAAKIEAFLAEKHLEINPKKTVLTDPGEAWTFLGISYQRGIMDVAPASAQKLKAKMRRKTRALQRWQHRKGLSGDKAAKAFIRHYNRKLFDNPAASELTWCLWYFPLINTDRTLRELDHYMQECIRVLASGRRTKSRYNVRYEDMKAMGYRSLVHEYYAREAETRESRFAINKGF